MTIDDVPLDFIDYSVFGAVFVSIMIGGIKAIVNAPDNELIVSKEIAIICHMVPATFYGFVAMGATVTIRDTVSNFLSNETSVIGAQMPDAID